MKEQMNQNRIRRLKLRIENQFHRGTKLERRYPGIERYVHSKRNGKYIRDMEKAVDQLVVVLDRIKTIIHHGKNVVIVGTSPVLGQLIEIVLNDIEKNATHGKRIPVTRAWISGIRTNYTNFQNYLIQKKSTANTTDREQEWYNQHRKERESRVIETDHEEVVDTDDQEVVRKKERPGLIFFRNPNDHLVGRKEARRAGVPTAGIVDTDCKYHEIITYPIPGNDDSRMAHLVRRRLMKKAVITNPSKE